MVGNEELAAARDVRNGRVEFHNLVGRLDADDGPLGKIWRVLSYYGRIVAFAARTDARLFHMLWFRKFPVVERVVLIGYFKLLGKRLAFTAHNVDDRARDGRRRTLPYRLSLKFLYSSVDHIFVHTPQMKRELVQQFDIAEGKVTVVPLGLNDVFPAPRVSQSEARRQFGLSPDGRIILCFGRIAPYKGIEDLIHALASLIHEDSAITLVLAGEVKDRSCEAYRAQLESLIDAFRLAKYIRKEIRYIPDGEVGLLFRASDVAVLPYRRIDQSGVLALSYAQGVPVIASDVGSFTADIVEGETGLVFRAGDVPDLAATIRAYFASDLFNNLEVKRANIRRYGVEAFSWARNGELTAEVYQHLLRE